MVVIVIMTVAGVVLEAHATVDQAATETAVTVTVLTSVTATATAVATDARTSTTNAMAAATKTKADEMDMDITTATAALHPASEISPPMNAGLTNHGVAANVRNKGTPAM